MSKKSKKKANKIKIGRYLVKNNSDLNFNFKLQNNIYFQKKEAKLLQKEIPFTEDLIPYVPYYNEFSSDINLSLTCFKKYNIQYLKSSTAKNITKFGARIDVLTIVSPTFTMDNTIFGVLNLYNYQQELISCCPLILNFFRHNEKEKNIENLITFQFVARVHKVVRGKEIEYHAIRPSKIKQITNMHELLQLYLDYLRPYYVEYNYDFVFENILLTIRHSNNLKLTNL